MYCWLRTAYTTCMEQGGGAVDGFSVYSSPDLANWKARTGISGQCSGMQWELANVLGAGGV